MSTDEVRLEHVALLLAVGLATADPQCLYEANKRLAHHGRAYAVAAHLRAAGLLDVQRPVSPEEASAALRYQLGRFVGDYGHLLNQELDDVEDIDHPNYGDGILDEEALRDLLDDGSSDE